MLFPDLSDIDECKDPQIAARCVQNAECCNLPAHFLCKCKDGYEGDGEVLCQGKLETETPWNGVRAPHCFQTHSTPNSNIVNATHLNI